MKHMKPKIIQREQMERKDWKQIYGFDYVEDKKYYNMLIDTTNLSPEEIVDQIMQAIKEE